MNHSLKLVLALLLGTVGTIYAQQTKPPKLMVGVVVDQMRYEYLNRFYNDFSEEGFKVLLNEGYNVKNTFYNYIPTYTGPGHASIYTGTTPRFHGIIANDWFNKKDGGYVYCVEDDAVIPVGTQSKYSKRSPKNLQASTLTDELKLYTNGEAKVIAISLKDRGAILPGGHAADAAYWFDYGTGNFVSSSYYLETLPEWVERFNKQKLAEKYLNQKWEFYLDEGTYTESDSDDRPYEIVYDNEQNSSFPHDLKAIQKIESKTNPKFEKEKYKLLTATPFGNTLVTDLAYEALSINALGKDTITDFLCVSYSSTDIVGHIYSPTSKEIHDTYIRLDAEIARLIKKLDAEVGRENYVLFLTADHAVVDNPDYYLNKGIPAGFYDFGALQDLLNDTIKALTNLPNTIRNISNDQFFLNHTAFVESEISAQQIQEIICEVALSLEYVQNAFPAQTINRGAFTENMEWMLKNGYNAKLSGDVLLVFKPNVMSNRKYGTTHGSGYRADRHVPFLLLGGPIRSGSTAEEHFITDIAPTIATLIQIPWPNSTIGKPVEDLFEK